MFHTPRELVALHRPHARAGRRQTAGFKLCVGPRVELLAICKAMVEEGITPDFIVVDGAEGGTGAAPMEYEDHVGTPLTEGLMTVHNALVGVGLRDRIKIGASGKVATGIDIVKRLAQGADYTNAARAMMMAVGCIQSQRCHTNTCPVGVATQDPKRARALDVADKTERVRRYQEADGQGGACGSWPRWGSRARASCTPHMLMRRVIDHAHRAATPSSTTGSSPGELLAEPPRRLGRGLGARRPRHLRRDWTTA